MAMDMVETAAAVEEVAAMAAAMGSSSTNTTSSLNIPLLNTMASAVRIKMGRRRATSRYWRRRNELPRSSKLSTLVNARSDDGCPTSLYVRTE
jgi:hypothetical protein